MSRKKWCTTICAIALAFTCCFLSSLCFTVDGTDEWIRARFSAGRITGTGFDVSLTFPDWPYFEAFAGLNAAEIPIRSDWSMSRDNRTMRCANGVCAYWVYAVYCWRARSYLGPGCYGGTTVATFPDDGSYR